MKKAVRIMTLCLAVAALGWGLLCFPKKTAAPAKPAKGNALPTAETAPFCLILVLTDGDEPTGVLRMAFTAKTAGVTGLPVHTRLSADGRFAALGELCTPSCAETMLAAIDRRFPDPPGEVYLFLTYASAERLMQTYFGGVTLTLEKDTPVPFIGGRLILPAGRCALTPQQVTAYWRQADDPVTAVQRQGEVIAILLERWLTTGRQTKADDFFADLVNAGETNWRVDRYARQKRTLAALARSGAAVRCTLPPGDVVGQGDSRRFELQEFSALEGAYDYE